MNRTAVRNLIAGSVALVAPYFGGGNSASGGEVAVVSHVKVLSDKVEDVSSLDAWRTSFIKPGMTDQQKAMAVWKSVVMFRHQQSPPNEFLEVGGNVHDPIKSFNVYGYGMCCCASANVSALARHAGLKARGWGIQNHSVPEVEWGGAWHMLDSSLITYFPKGSPDGPPAGVEELAKDISAWYERNPKMKGNNDALVKYMRGGGWKNGPELLRNCPSYDNNGWFPAATHGWYATMQEYADPKKTFIYEYGTAAGYQVNVQLRQGERLTRNWGNTGLHVNAPEGGELSLLTQAGGKDDLRYAPAMGDLAPGRVGNGTLAYDVPVRSAELAGAALTYENVGPAGAGLGLKDASKPGVLVIRMPSSYVYLSGKAEIKAAVGPAGGMKVAYSENNGLDWKDVATVSESGSQTIDLKALVYRRYDYRLRITMGGAGTKLEGLKLTHDVQHSQRALPALAKGSNTITFASGAQEGTITVQGSMAASSKGKNLSYTDFHPQATGMKEFPPFLEKGKGEITFPVATPGDMARVRVGIHYRARDARDGFDVTASFDDGATWRKVTRLAGPTGSGHSTTFTIGDVPKGARAALVKFAGVQFNTTGIQDLRIDADYAEPGGGFAPVKVTYVWEENGVERRDVHVAKGASETYTITRAEKPGLKSLIVERGE